MVNLVNHLTKVYKSCYLDPFVFSGVTSPPTSERVFLMWSFFDPSRNGVSSETCNFNGCFCTMMSQIDDQASKILLGCLKLWISQKLCVCFPLKKTNKLLGQRSILPGHGRPSQWPDSCRISEEKMATLWNWTPTSGVGKLLSRVDMLETGSADVLQGI